MNYRLIAAAIVVILGIGLGLVLWNTFSNQPSQRQLNIREVEWTLEGDYLAMHISIENVGTTPVVVEAIGVRRETAGSPEYIDDDPEDMHNAENSIPGGAALTFKWNSTSGAAPFNFLQWDNTYVIKVTFQGGTTERAVIASA